MPTAFTGSLGWTGAHPIQLGGPPLVHSWSRPIAAKALPLLAHAYDNDGVTFLGTFGLLRRPAIKDTTANGGQPQVTLDVQSRGSGMIWGQFVWGTTVWGGTGVSLALGNVVRLTEVGGPWNGFIYGGIVESLPDTRSSSGTTHQILLTPFGAELTRVASQALYTAPVDIAVAIRDAVALCKHCSCDQVSVPVSTGIPLISTSGAAVDFRGQKANQILDTCRSIAGPSWYWWADADGRVWFQPQGSGAVYTVLPPHAEQRTSNGGDIQSRINQVPAVGGVPPGGSANVKAQYDGPSQAALGVRTLDPPLAVPGITDQVTLQALANGIGATLDQTWTRVALTVLPPRGGANEKHPGRIHQSQPGGAMVRYYEPPTNPLPESGSGAGYVGPFILQSVDYDGARQVIEAGNIPVTSQTDVQNMVQRWVSRSTAISLINTAASLNLSQTLTGTFQSGTGTVTSQGQRATLWSIGQDMFQAFDPNGIARWQQGNMPANGISPAQWGARANDANGVPFFDTLGLIGVMSQLGQSDNTTGYTNNTLAYTVISGSAVTFTLARAVRIFCLANCFGFATTQTGLVTIFVDGVSQGALWPSMIWGGGTGGASLTGYGSGTFGAGSHTVDLRGAMQAIPGSLSLGTYDLSIWQLGS